MIGVVTTSYPRFPGDGAGVFVRERVRALLAAGQEVEVVAAGDGETRAEPGVTRLATQGLFYSGGAPEALEGVEVAARMAAWGEALGFSLALLGHLGRAAGRWHAVESHWLLPCGLATCMALPGLPHRAHLHGGDVYLLERLPWAGSLARAICRSGPELVFASASLLARFSAAAEAFPDALGARCLVEPAPFDRSIFHARTEAERRRARTELGGTRPLLLAAGRLVPIKGYDLLLAAVARMARATRPVVVIAGDGPARSRLAQQARAAGVELRLPGNLDQEALAVHMAAAALFVHPSRTLPSGRSEGMPLVVREALARGLPVVASSSGGLRELAGAPGLALVPADDVSALAEAIARALVSG